MPRGSRPGERRGGRQKGTPNRTTVDARAAFQAIFDNNVARAEGWLLEVAAENPGKALDSFLKLSEHFVPKLSSLKVDIGTMSVSDILAELERRAGSQPDQGPGTGETPST